MVSYTSDTNCWNFYVAVLILVVVDDGLVLYNNVEVNDFDTKVLILVVVDDGLVLRL